MAHLHTDYGAHDVTASGYVVLSTDKEPRIWLHWHKKLHQWMQFGGHVEHHESPWTAVLHELLEESGYTASQIQVLQPKNFLKSLTSAVLHPADVCINTHSFPELNHFHTDIAYAFVTTEQPVQSPADGE